MKSFFVFFGIVGVIIIAILGIVMSIGIPSNPREVVKEISIK